MFINSIKTSYGDPQDDFSETAEKVHRVASLPIN
ncbi:hypothetical protein BIW11_04263 [Tropilaelaps mercedesae]|uniref:Uncharacterized protein n=1 Tax=Tropilaelaps mercedesae TaxID=418985 RepID=A0A1V9X998_9ACAR|nr:hypothetical protein BIW11_04263 [Tropilaelaps mercedesae]